MGTVAKARASYQIATSRTTRSLPVHRIKEERMNFGNSCPHCGGQSGVKGVRHEKFSIVWDWEGQSLAVDSMGVAYETRVGKCLDCGKRVKVPKK
jgi:hypothetical protein